MVRMGLILSNILKKTYSQCNVSTTNILNNEMWKTKVLHENLNL